jgi:glycine/D-amino acid oxidase-like deaminating enzyme
MTVGHAIWPDQLLESERGRLHPGIPAALDRAPEVLVVGGGILGCATAAACVQAGLGSVVLVERDTLGAGASGGAAGLLLPEAHVGVDPPEFVAAMRQSLVAWRELQATWPGGVGLLPLEWHGQAQGRLNPLRAIARLATELPCVATGVWVTGIESAGGRVHTVRTSAGPFRPRNVVFATGVSPELPGLPVVPSSEVKGHMLCTAPTDLTRVGDSDLARLIEDGRLLMGGTLDVGDAERVVRPEVVASMLSELRAAWPEAHLEVDDAWACFRPAHPDFLPVIDRVPGLSNAWLTSGHYKTGILMAPASGYAIAHWLSTGSPPAWVAPFSAVRPFHRGAAPG